MAKPTYDELIAYAQEMLRKRSGLTNFSESSIIGTLVNTNAAFSMGLHNRLDFLEKQTKVTTATGIYLDMIGESRGVYRLEAKSATTAGAGKSVQFTNPTLAQATVPARTRVWSSRNPAVTYYTNYDILVPAGASEYVDVTAVSSGAEFNVGPGSLNSHNAEAQSLSVTNVTAISNGMSVEDDDNYRYRIINAVLAQQGGNATAIRMRLLQLPDIRDVVIQDMVRGAGTVDIIIVPVGRYVTRDLLERAQSAVDEVVSFISAVVKAPIERPVDVLVHITVSSTGDATLAKSLASAAVRNYIDNLPIGDKDGSGDLMYNELLSRVMNAHKDIRDADVQLNVDNKQALRVNQKAAPGERFYLQSVKVV